MIPILYWSGPLPVRGVASLVRAMFSPGGAALVGSACTRCGAFFMRSADPPQTWGPVEWSQRTRPGIGPRRWTRPMEVTSAPNPVSTIGFAYPKCGSSALTASRSGSSALNDALRLAQEADLDLVEVAPTARPPVCKLMDYGKFKYESALKARESRKNQAQTVIKEIKLRPKIDPHDYGTKKGHVERFLKAGRQGQGDDHVPGARAVPAGARVPAAAAPGRRCGGARLRGSPSPSRTAAT